MDSEELRKKLSAKNIKRLGRDKESEEIEELYQEMKGELDEILSKLDNEDRHDAWTIALGLKNLEVARCNADRLTFDDVVDGRKGEEHG